VDTFASLPPAFEEGLTMLTPVTNGAARERVDFSKIKTSIPIPNLIEVQKKSYERFL